MNLMAELGPFSLSGTKGTGHCGSAPLDSGAHVCLRYHKRSPPPLGLKKKKEFLKGCCHHPQVDNNHSESKCKLRMWRNFISTFASLKNKNKDFQMSIAI